MHYPKNIHLVMDKLRFRLGHHQVEQRTLAVRHKLIAMRVIKELQSVFGERFTSPIEDLDRFATGRFVKGIFMGNPGAADILLSQDLCLSSNSFDIVTASLIREMAADRFQSSTVQLGSEFLRRKSVSAVRLNVLNAKVANLIQRFGHISGELVTQTVKLQTNPLFQVLAHVGLWLRCGARVR